MVVKVAVEKNSPTPEENEARKSRSNIEPAEVKTIVHTLELNQARMVLNLLLSTATRRDCSSIPVLHFLRSSLDSGDESEGNNDDILTGRANNTSAYNLSR